MKYWWIWYWSRVKNWKMGHGYSSRDDNRLFGLFRVRYLDGRVTTPMYYRTAVGYANIFGGKVILKDEEEIRSKRGGIGRRIRTAWRQFWERGVYEQL